MFTGIVTARGRIAATDPSEDRLRLQIEAPYPDLSPGESIAVNGACLTVVDLGDGWFAVEAVVTTRGRTTVGDWRVGDHVNLERALRVGDRLGGHFVQGHVDGVAEVVEVAERDDALLVDLRLPDEVAAVSVLHGSIAVDGVSMTVNALPADHVAQISLIPFTREHTTLGAVRVGDRVHVEGDMIGKFVRQLMVDRERE